MSRRHVLAVLGAAGAAFALPRSRSAEAAPPVANSPTPPPDYQAIVGLI